MKKVLDSIFLFMFGNDWKYKHNSKGKPYLRVCAITGKLEQRINGEWV